MKAILALNTKLSTINEINLLEALGLSVIQRMMGMYKGVEENSYKVVSTDLYDIYKIANIFEQESILIFDKVKTNLVYLMNVKTRKLMLSGKWVNKGAVMPMNVDAYSFDGNNYYVIE